MPVPTRSQVPMPILDSHRNTIFHSEKVPSPSHSWIPMCFHKWTSPNIHCWHRVGSQGRHKAPIHNHGWDRLPNLHMEAVHHKKPEKKHLTAWLLLARF